MLDFVEIATRTKKDIVECYPVFLVRDSKDLMIRGHSFYAIWDDETQLWTKDGFRAIGMIDDLVRKAANEYQSKTSYVVRPLLLQDSDTGMIDKWLKFTQKQMPDCWHNLDETLVFSNTEPDRKYYASRRLPYPLEDGPMDCYNELVNVLYSPEERHKLEWCIGSIVSGDSKRIQKFAVLYGSGGTGKGTMLDIVKMMFSGYYATFEAKNLGSKSDSFSLEAFKDNPLVAIDPDGDLSNIEDNTRLNSLVAHEEMLVNEKFKSRYSMKFNAFLLMGTNRPVRITDAKSGIIRRLIDISPTGITIPQARYEYLMSQIPFELGGIAQHCLDIYLEDRFAYNNYIPVSMLSASNHFYNYMLDMFETFQKDDGTSLTNAWVAYKAYCEEANVSKKYPQYMFKEELKNYFREFIERGYDGDNIRVWNLYKGFITDKFIRKDDSGAPTEKDKITLVLDQTESLLDRELADCPAQYAKENDAPEKRWDDVQTTLKNIDTTKVHYVRLPKNHIVIDFDLKGKDGVKSYDKNLKAASKFPPTYAEVSKGGAGIHLHYIYDGDVSKLSRVYDDNIEIKVFTGKSALRRRLSKCNNLPIAHLNSGLPLKESDKKVLNETVVKDEMHIRALIRKALNKEVHDSTKPNVDFIFKILEDAYNGGVVYDVNDLRPAVVTFASKSHNQSDTCLKIVAKMHFASEVDLDNLEKYDDDALYFFDVEVFPNLFIICWKQEGENHPCVRMINPSPMDVAQLTKRKLVGFNNRRYDNKILYARMAGYSNPRLYLLSTRIINGSENASMRASVDLSYTDIYDFASAGNKKSLKKLEIEMGIHHLELGLPWDKPVPEDQWLKVADYCCNDVIATEAAFHYLHGDWVARQILAGMAGMTVNDSTNQLTTRFIFGKDRSPQGQFNYRNLAEPALNLGYPKAYFPGYVFDKFAKTDKSTYRGEVVGEGGYVYAEPGIYHDVALLDIASMHPSSIIAEQLFGPKYTPRFKEIVDARVAVKHKDWATAETMLDGLLVPYIEQVKAGELTPKQLANALKTAINSVYGLTSAKFDNPFRDPRNVDNIVAKRGALFMVDLKHAVQEKGFTVAHIKTDSIKIPNATPEIISFVMEFGHEYGYNFEHEATYDRMCLVNDAVYIAKFATAEKCESLYGYAPGENRDDGGKWTATGAQFAVPYIFKTLFSHEEIQFEDMCETKSVTSAMYLDMNEELGEDEHNYIFVGRAGQFCPIKAGCGGGILLREKEGKYSSVTGTKGYRFLESETVRNLGMEDAIDRSYYVALVDAAVAAISEYGNFDEFVDD